MEKNKWLFTIDYTQTDRRKVLVIGYDSKEEAMNMLRKKYNINRIYPCGTVGYIWEKNVNVD